MIERALCRHWQAQGHDLIVWNRTPECITRLYAGTYGTATLRELDGAALLDAVINLAGASITDRPWSALRRRILWRGRVDLTRELVDWLDRCRQPPRAFVSGSATSRYGDRGQEPLNEDSRTGKDDFDSQLCVAWEEEARHAETLGIHIMLLHTTPVFASDGGMLPRPRLPFGMGPGGRLGNGYQWMPWIHLDDVVSLIDFLLRHADCWGTFDAYAPDLVRNADFANTLAATLRGPMFLSVPAWVLRVALGEMSVLLLGSQRLQPRRVLEADYRLRLPNLEEALTGLLMQNKHPVTR